MSEHEEMREVLARVVAEIAEEYDLPTLVEGEAAGEGDLYVLNLRGRTIADLIECLERVEGRQRVLA